MKFYLKKYKVRFFFKVNDEKKRKKLVMKATKGFSNND
jgi:hypothetical protein